MFAALAAALVLASSPEPPTGAEVYAVIVGHNGGTTGLPPLKYADDDALRFSRWFTAITSADRIWTLASPDEDTRGVFRAAGMEDPPQLLPPTRAGLMRALGELKARLGARDRTREAHVYFLYAGHGLGGRVLLEPELSGEAGISGRELRAWFGALDATRVLLFFDACRSQSLFADRGSVGFGPDFAAEIDALEARAGAARMGVLTAATSDKPAGETAMLRAGYFSHVLLSGMAGAADADLDGRVLFGELAAFVAFNTQRLTPQRPWFEPPGGDLNELAVDLRAPRSRLLMGPELGGHFLIAAQPGAPLFVEVQKPRGQALALALPPGEFRVTRVERTVSEFSVPVVVRGGETAELPSDAAFVELPRRPVTNLRGGDVPFDPALSGFHAPFTPQVVTALTTGYQAGREPSLLRARWRHRLSLGYGLGPAPFSLPGVEHGIDLSWRTRFGRVVAGARADLRLSEHVIAGAPFGLRRGGLLAQVGTSFQLGDRVELGPFATGGVRSIFRVARGEVSSADVLAPTAGAGAWLDVELAERWSLFSEARFELSWVLFDGVRQPFAAPAIAVGIARAF